MTWMLVTGFLSLLEESADFRGEGLSMAGAREDMGVPGSGKAFDVWFCDAMDGSPFLLLGGYDHGRDGETGAILVVDGRDGALYEVCEGIPVGWR
ncbi:MAG: hypothetical protein QME88_04925 [Actinomycetota bacterium]|nr:hypothetical protein [Actinomycetota bacterium]